MRIEWIKKEISNPLEVENINFLLNKEPTIMPRIRGITKRSYLVEGCHELLAKDIYPENIHVILNNCLRRLYAIKDTSFTPGIYKYYGPNSIRKKERSRYYIPYLTNELIGVITSVPLPSYGKTDIAKLLSTIQNKCKNSEEWQPENGYSLLHGDLHLGNVVKKGSNYLLIDFEYMRFGAAELEISNFLISVLTWRFNTNDNPRSIALSAESYLNIVEQLNYIDSAVFSYFFFLAATLNFIRLSLLEDHRDMDTLRMIIRLIK